MRAALSADMLGELIHILIAVLCPPIAVFMRVGLKSQFWLNLLLTLMAYIPGLVHAIWLLAQTSDRRLLTS